MWISKGSGANLACLNQSRGIPLKNIHMQVVLSCNLLKTVSVWKDVKIQTHSNLGQYICRVFSGSVLPTHSGLAVGRSLTNVYSTENFKER